MHETGGKRALVECRTTDEAGIRDSGPAGRPELHHGFLQLEPAAGFGKVRDSCQVRLPHEWEPFTADRAWSVPAQR